MQKIYTIIICCIISTGIVFAQNDSLLVYDTSNTDLLYTSGPNINQPLQDFQSSIGFDKDNVYYIGSEGGGLCVFDGLDWTQITRDNTSDKLLSDFITVVYIASDGDKWIGINGTNGVIRMGKNNIITQYTTANTSGKYPNGNKVKCIGEDAAGNIYVGTAAGLGKFNGTSWTLFDMSNSNIPHNEVNSVAYNAITDDIWIGTVSGIAKYNGSSWQAYTTADGLPDNNVTSVAVDDIGTVWFGTFLFGIGLFDGSDWDTLLQSDGLPNNLITAISFDKQGNPWVGTLNGGLGYYNGSSWDKIKKATHGIPDNTIRGIGHDNYGNTCITTDKGFAIFKRGGIIYTIRFGVDNICFGSAANSGSISATPYYGTPPYTYAWDDPSSQTTQTASNLQQGTYIVVITDSLGVIASDTETIFQSTSAITSSIVIIDSPTIVGGGSLDLTVSGGNPPYTYIWSNGSEVEDPDELTQGTHTVTITDDIGCKDTASIELISNVPQLTHNNNLFRIYPNPVSGNTFVYVKLESPYSFTLQLYDLHGKRIKTLPVELNSNKNQIIELPTQLISNGIYFLTLQSDQFIATSKVIILH